MSIAKIPFLVRKNVSCTCINSLDVGPYISFTFLYFTTLLVMYFIILCTYLSNKHKTNYKRCFILNVNKIVLHYVHDVCRLH